MVAFRPSPTSAAVVPRTTVYRMWFAIMRSLWCESATQTLDRRYLRLSGWAAGSSLERQISALLGVRQTAACQSCRHCREQASRGGSGLDQGTTRPAAAPPHHPEGATTFKSDVRTLKKPRLANGGGRQIEAESSRPRPPPLRYGGRRGAGSGSQRGRRVTFQLCTDRDISTLLQHRLA